MALVTAAQVKAECINDTHFNEDFIKDGYILSAQLEYIKPYLGDDFYDALVADDSGYYDLTAKLYPALKWFAYYKALPFINIRTTNQGVVNYNSDYTDNASDAKKANIMQEAYNIGMTYLNECTRFLSDNSADYPLWKRQEQIKQSNMIFYDSNEEIYNENNDFYRYEDNN